MFVPKHGDLGRKEDWLASQGFFDPRISIRFSTYYIYFFSVGCFKGGVPRASHPNPPPPPHPPPHLLPAGWGQLNLRYLPP